MPNNAGEVGNFLTTLNNFYTYIYSTVMNSIGFWIEVDSFYRIKVIVLLLLKIKRTFLMD